MDKRIILSAKEKKEIMKILRVSEATISCALKFKWKSHKAQMIQNLAMNKYNGILLEIDE